MVDHDDWISIYRNAAARQGWCISETDDTVDQLQIQRLTDAGNTGAAWNVEIPQLESDDDAVLAMKAAFFRSEDHAILAWNIIRNTCHQEFSHWDMQSCATPPTMEDSTNT